MHFITKVFWAFRPIVKFIDKAFTAPFSVKKITGDHYYLWRDQIQSGMVFLTNIRGSGSNLINPSDFNHSAIYFGKGLKSAIIEVLNDLVYEYDQTKDVNLIPVIDRLNLFLLNHDISDHICYVIEALGKGVVISNLVTFITTKDRVMIFSPKFASLERIKDTPKQTLRHLGLPYDYGFAHDNNAKYCFELVVDAYQDDFKDLKLHQKVYSIFGKELYRAYLSDTFTDKDNWMCVIDSKDYIV